MVIPKKKTEFLERLNQIVGGHPPRNRASDNYLWY